MAKKRYTKAEEEIIQILNEADHEPVWRRVRLPRGSQRRGPRPPREFRFDTTWLWFGASFGLALVAILIAGWSQTLAILLAILSILAFLSPIVVSRRPSHAAPEIRRWRGRDIDLPPSRAGLVGKIRYRFWQMRNRR